jgi:hypothetical protein
MEIMILFFKTSLVPKRNKLLSNTTI